MTSNLLEVSGAPSATDASGVEDACMKRDHAIRSYFENELSKILLVSDSKEKLMALAREVSVTVTAASVFHIQMKALRRQSKLD